MCKATHSACSSLRVPYTFSLIRRCQMQSKSRNVQVNTTEAEVACKQHTNTCSSNNDRLIAPTASSSSSGKVAARTIKIAHGLLLASPFSYVGFECYPASAALCTLDTTTTFEVRTKSDISSRCCACLLVILTKLTHGHARYLAKLSIERSC